MRELPRPVSVEEALRESTVTIDVPEGETLTVGPFAERFYEEFRLAEVKEFTDLQRLGFIHPNIAEDQLVDALRADDRLYREAVQQQHVMGEDSPCNCDEPNIRAVPRISRRYFQHNMIDLLQPLYRDSLSADDPAVLHPYHHATAWTKKSALLLVGLYNLLDINIADDATLIMTPTVQALFAININIGKRGRLRFTSGNVHVRASNLNGPSRFSDRIDLYVHGLSRENREVQ